MRRFRTDEHLQDDPGVGRQHPQVFTDGGGQRPGQREPPRRPRIEAGPLAQHRAQVQRVPAGALVQPPDGLIVQRSRPERGRQRRHLVQIEALQRYEQPVLHALQHPLGRLVQPVPGPAVDHHGEHRVDRQPPQHERQRLHRPAVGPLQVIDHDRHRTRGQLLAHHLQQPRAHGERRGSRAGPCPRAQSAGTTPPAARSSWSTIPKSRSASAWSARADSTLRPGASARQRRARAVFPSPGSPSMATSHGCPASTRVMTSATRVSSAARPTKTSSGACRSCTRPPRSRPWRRPPRTKTSVAP